MRLSAERLREVCRSFSRRTGDACDLVARGSSDPAVRSRAAEELEAASTRPDWMDQAMDAKSIEGALEIMTDYGWTPQRVREIIRLDDDLDLAVETLAPNRDVEIDVEAE